jgi:1-acyl-sn-glycerol-3-phosphate acyltransferase
MTTSIEEALAFEPPARDEVEHSLGVLRWYFSPEVTGIENVDRNRPTLFVGNHTRFGLLDVPLITREIYLQTGIFPRGLADRIHYKLPLWKEVITNGGGVLGSREMCRALMQSGESIMVFPGGAREVFKGRARNYQLLWKNRLGFVRMAVENGYSITPFCSVGADEVFDVVIDGEDIMNSAVGKLIKWMDRDAHRLRDDMQFPLPRGIGLTAVPRPEKFYFSFGKPIDTTRYTGQSDDETVLRRVRRQTARSIEKLLADTLLYRAQSRDGISVWRKILQKT